MNRLAFHAEHGRGPTLAQLIADASTLAELEYIRAGREHVARVCGDALWPDGEGLLFTLRKAELGKREASAK